MQLFGNEGKGDKQNSVQIGNYQIKVVKASSLLVGTHPVRFYPLSPQFFDGADYINIVQHVHWLNRQPCICRRTSYDFSVPDTQQKSIIDVSCVICNDKFAWFKKAMSLKESNPQESNRLKEIGKDLMEKILVSSIVSFTDSNGNLTFPVILRYGKELLDQIQLNAHRIIQGPDGKGNGPHICDPSKGYMFDIIIGKNDGDFRTYKNSMPSVNSSPVDITQAPWNWQEICEAIRSEIMHIPTPDEVYNFYVTNYSCDQTKQTFVHPAFQNQSGNRGNNGGQQNFMPPNNSQTGGGFTPPQTEEKKETAFTPPNNNNNGGQGNNGVLTFTVPANNGSNNAAAGLYPCNSQLPNGSGYDQNDSNCKSCPQAKGCYENSTPFKTEAKVAPGAGNNNASSPAAGNANNGGTFNTNDVQDRLNVLNQKMQNNS